VGRLPGQCWMVVWCYESCHKEDNRPQRHALATTLRNHGATLFCCKKAAMFGDWVAQERTQTYILLTDWRQLKPCSSFLKQQNSSEHPSLTVVLFADPKTCEKVYRWARHCFPCKLHVCTSLEPLDKFITSLAQHVPGNDAELPVGCFSATRIQSRGVPSSVQPTGVQLGNKAKASKTATFSSWGKSNIFGTRENPDLSLHNQRVEDEGNCEVSWFVGIPGTPRNLPCKASDDSFPATGPMKQAWSQHADFQDVGSCF